MGYKNAANVLPHDLLNRVKKFCTGRLWIPKTGGRGARLTRNKKIFQLRRQGMTIACIARNTGLSKRQVIRILSHTD